jgi:hypothetical protein
MPLMIWHDSTTTLSHQLQNCVTVNGDVAAGRVSVTKVFCFKNNLIFGMFFLRKVIDRRVRF